jgi:hypothetical protein
MKTPDLIQSRMFHKVKLTLEPDGIAVDERNLSRSSKTHVYFESIPPKSREITVSSRKITFAAIIVTILAVICLPLAFTPGAKNGWEAPVFWCVVAAILWTGFFSSRKSLIKFVQNNSGLNLYRNKPSEKAVDEFVQKMFRLRNAYFQKKYGRFLDEESLENKMARLNYLRAQEVLSEEEFESRREEFTKGNKPSGPLGFAPQQN